MFQLPDEIIITGNKKTLLPDGGNGSAVWEYYLCPAFNLEKIKKVVDFLKDQWYHIHVVKRRVSTLTLAPASDYGYERRFVSGTHGVTGSG